MLERKILQWIANDGVGASSMAMAMCAANILTNPYHPHDPADLNRCLQLLYAVPEIRNHFAKIGRLSTTWSLLIKRWDELETCFINEVGINWSKGSRAPKTYALMKEIEDAARNNTQGNDQ